MTQDSRVKKLAGGFFNISGGAVGPRGEFYFVDAHWQRIHKWDPVARQVGIVSDAPLQPINLAVDQAGNLMVISYADGGAVYALDSAGNVTSLKPQSAVVPSVKNFYLPASDWHLSRESLSHPAAWFISRDETTAIPAGEDFLKGATSWGVESSGQIRSFGLNRVAPGNSCYVTSEAELRTWQADANPDGSLTNFRLFAEQGGEYVTADSRGNVYIAAGQIYVRDSSGKLFDTIKVPERPVQMAFGDADYKTLYIAARTSLYAARLKYSGTR